MIRNFRHRGLERLFTKGDERGIQTTQAPRIRRLLDAINAARDVKELDIPGYGFHPLKGSRVGQWSLKVSGNWRVTFRFEGEDAADVDLEDYH